MTKNHDQIPTGTLLFIDRLMQFLGDALIRFRTWWQTALNRGGVFDKVVSVLFPNVEADRSQ